MRVIVYEMRGGSEELFKLPNVEAEQHERAEADREMHSRDTAVVGFHFEDIPYEEYEQRGGH